MKTWLLIMWCGLDLNNRIIYLAKSVETAANGDNADTSGAAFMMSVMMAVDRDGNDIFRLTRMLWTMVVLCSNVFGCCGGSDDGVDETDDVDGGVNDSSDCHMGDDSGGVRGVIMMVAMGEVNSANH